MVEEGTEMLWEGERVEMEILAFVGAFHQQTESLALPFLDLKGAMKRKRKYLRPNRVSILFLY